MNLVKGKDTDIVFTEITEDNMEKYGRTKDDIGKYAVDVYYV